MNLAAPIGLQAVLQRTHRPRQLDLPERPRRNRPVRLRPSPWLELLLAAALVALGTALWLARPRPARGATGPGVECWTQADCPPALACVRERCR